MTKNLNIIKRHIRKLGLMHIPPPEIIEYFNYRIRSSIIRNYFLTKGEILYLLCETGIGGSRFDPEIVNLLIKSSTWESYDLEQISIKKRRIENDIKKDLSSSNHDKFWSEFYKKYINNLVKLSDRPLIFKGNFNETKVKILNQNGYWIMPEKYLLEFISQSLIEERVPIIVSTKIHGVLFPFLKSFSSLGVNTYTTFVDEKTFKKCVKFNTDPNNVKEHIKYNQRLSALNHLGDFEILNNFFKNLLPNLIPAMSSLTNKLFIGESFESAIDSIKSKKVKTHLLDWAKTRKNVIGALNKIKTVV